MGRVWVLLLLLMAGACEDSRIEWSDVTYPAQVAATVSTIDLPRDGACKASVRLAVSGKDSVAVWWSARPDSSSALMFARKSGDAWTAPVPVDTTDASRRGCARPAPAIAMNASAGYLHIAYFLEQATGPGVFFAHSMDETGFHDPVSISYGRRASNVSIAANGDRVVVAYEEPNAERGHIWVALSETMGHIFEARMPVSSVNQVSKNPSVSLDGTKLEVRWEELLQADSLRRNRLATRTGTWK